MPQTYIVINKHTPEECEAMDAGMTHLPERMNGKDFICTCPYGEHGFYMLLEGDSIEELIGALPSELRRGTRALAVEIMRLPD
jgi:hypothetical protein